MSVVIFRRPRPGLTFDGRGPFLTAFDTGRRSSRAAVDDLARVILRRAGREVSAAGVHADVGAVGIVTLAAVVDRDCVAQVSRGDSRLCLAIQHFRVSIQCIVWADDAF